MEKYEITKIKKPQLNIGDKFGCLTVCSEPYYIIPPGAGHRRQYFDLKCDCGNIKEGVKGLHLKRGNGVLLYCGRDCPLYIEDMPQNVPEDSKLCKVGEQYNYLTVTKEAFYYQEKGSTNRYKYIEVQCKCGKYKKYRESKVYKGTFKSCGCVWEHKDKKERDWSQYEKKYGLNEQDYKDLFEKQEGKCAICNNKGSGTKITKYLSIDHCHDTGKIRGLLCSSCNTGLGLFKEKIENFEKAIIYLKENNEIFE